MPPLVTLGERANCANSGVGGSGSRAICTGREADPVKRRGSARPI